MTDFPVVYLMESLATGRGYVGSTQNLKRRKSDHKSKLDSLRHHNPDVQAEFDQYGWRNFRFHVLEAVIDGDLIGAENKWIERLSDNLFNKRRAASRDEETRRRISEALTGKKQSEAHREANRAARMGNTNAKGSIRSDEYRNAKGRPVVVTDPQGNSTTYPRIALAAEMIGYERANMIRVLRNGGTVKRGEMRGWRFAYGS